MQTKPNKSNNPNGNPAWTKGKPVYSEWLKTLSKEDYEAHLRKRALDKEDRMKKLTRKQVFEEVLDAQKAQWVAESNNIMVTHAKEAKLGNVQSARLVFEYLFGKPETQVDITSNGNTLQAPTIIFKTRQIDDWKDIDSDEV